MGGDIEPKMVKCCRPHTEPSSLAFPIKKQNKTKHLKVTGDECQCNKPYTKTTEINGHTQTNTWSRTQHNNVGIS